jgi:hypothetical protein
VAQSSIHDALRAIERAEPDEQWAVLCFLAGRGVMFDTADRSAALRRAELLLAAGGDPRRPLALYGRAVSALAVDLDSMEARRQLAAGLDELESEVVGLPGAAEALRLLRGDEELAWQAFAMSILAEELSGD